MMVAPPPQVTEVEVKWRGAPEGAPTASEDLSAGRIVGGEEGDDIAYILRQLLEVLLWR